MGITAMLTTAMKQVSWGQVADIAMKYGPDFIRKLKDRLQARPVAESAEAETVEQLGERIRELESAIVKQQEVIEQQQRSMVQLEEIGKTLQARLNIFMAIAALSAVLSVVVCILLLRR